MIDFKDITYNYSPQSGVYNIDLKIKNLSSFLKEINILKVA